MTYKFRAWHPYLKQIIAGKLLWEACITLNPVTGKLTQATLQKSLCSGNVNYVTGNVGMQDNSYLIPMLFTGLMDKNGVEIYEGDIVRIRTSEEMENEIHSITFNNAQFHFLNSAHYNLKHIIDDCFEFEIIGNIYETPELSEQP